MVLRSMFAFSVSLTPFPLRSMFANHPGCVARTLRALARVLSRSSAGAIFKLLILLIFSLMVRDGKGPVRWPRRRRPSGQKVGRHPGEAADFISADRVLLAWVGNQKAEIQEPSGAAP